MNRNLAVAVITLWIDPVGFDREDGRCPDAITVFPFSQDKCLYWDATYVNWLNESAE